MPFFIPVKSYDTRVQVLDNVSWVRGNHLFKTGFEWNRTAEHQTFIGFANGRFIFNSVTSFENYVRFGNNYVECSNAAGVQVSTSLTGSCPPLTSISGPVQLYLQQAGVGGRSVKKWHAGNSSHASRCSPGKLEARRTSPSTTASGGRVRSSQIRSRRRRRCSSPPSLAGR